MTTVQTKVLMPEKKKKVTLAQVILVTIIMLFVLICVLPIINVASVSLSSKSAILRGDVAFLPVEPTINAYKAIVRDASMIRSLFYTIELTVIYTAMAMVMTILLRGRRLLSLFVIFTMYFNGGAIPTYLTIKNYGLINSMWSLILPGLISTYNMIILRSFISALPGELEEAAIIDGATDFQVLLKVILPLTLPAIATLSLFYAVGKWNSFSDALYYISSASLQPLQLKLYNLIKGSTTLDISAVEGNSADLGHSISESIESASIIFATLPILVVYPFLQRYFVSGVTVGAVKG